MEFVLSNRGANGCDTELAGGDLSKQIDDARRIVFGDSFMAEFTIERYEKHNNLADIFGRMTSRYHGTSMNMGEQRRMSTTSKSHGCWFREHHTTLMGICFSTSHSLVPKMGPHHFTRLRCS